MAFSSTELQSTLLNLQKHYDARSPAVPTLIPLPSARQLARTATQEWIVANLIVPEEALANDYFSNEEEREDIGSANWRRAFWKRIVGEIDIGIRESPEEEELECHEKILMLLADLMANPGIATISLRRHYYTFQDQPGLVVTCEDDATISQGTTGLRTWQASIRLANHLIAHPALLQGKRVLELGSGAGMLSILIAQLQSRSGKEGSVIATDLDERVLQRLQGNIKRNRVDNVHVRRLSWAEEAAIRDLPDFDVVLGADVTYDPDLAPLLVGCLTRLLKDGKEAYISATVRNETTQNTFTAHNLSIQEEDFRIPVEGYEIVGGYEELASVRLFRIWRKDG